MKTNTSEYLRGRHDATVAWIVFYGPVLLGIGLLVGRNNTMSWDAFTCAYMRDLIIDRITELIWQNTYLDYYE